MIRVNNTTSSAFSDKKSIVSQKNREKDFLQNVAENDDTEHDQASRDQVIQRMLKTDYSQQVENTEIVEQEFVTNILQNSTGPEDGIAPLLNKYETEATRNFTNQLSVAHKTPLTELEIQNLMVLIPDAQINASEITALVEQMLMCEAGNELAMLDQYLKKFTNYAAIYLILELILSRMKKSKKKGSLILEVAEILDEFSVQQGAFLCEFFSLSKNKELQEKLGGNAIQQIARVNTSAITFSNIRQFIEFIKVELKDDFSNLLRTILKIKATQIASINVLNFEDRYKLSEAVKLEYYIFIIYSFFLKSVKFKRKLSNIKVATIDRNGDLLLQLLNLFESSIINEATLINSLQTITLAKPDHMQFMAIIAQLIVLITELNEAVFANNVEQKSKLVNWLRSIAKNKDDKQKASPKTAELSFLRPKLIRIPEYV